MKNPNENPKHILLKEAFRIFSRNIKTKIKGLEIYSGNDEEICKSIINSCYDSKNKYFQASAGNYKAFYARDFGWCIESLMRLGYAKEIHNTLEYALNRYSQYSGISVAISCEGIPYNFPNVYSADSTAYMFRCLRISKSKDIILKHRKFLNKEIAKFEENVIDKDSGMVKSEVFSGMRDHVMCKASGYDMIMACMLCNEIDSINKSMGDGFLNNTLKNYDLEHKLIKHYWTGKYFRDGIGKELCSGHTNVYPYYLRIINDRNMLKSSIKSIQENMLDKPFPLKYGYDNTTKFIALEFFTRDWEKDTVWALLKYKRNIEKYKGFTELYTNKGTPYKSLFYSSDNSMLWASMYLDLKHRLKKTDKK